MQVTNTVQERKSKQLGIIVTTLVHTILIAILLIPLLKNSTLPLGSSGILVNLGLPDQGQGEENTPGPLIANASTKKEAATETLRQPAASKSPKEKLLTTDDPEAIALNKKQEQEARDRQAREAEEARTKAEAEQLKKQISGLLGGGGKGSGKGTTGKPGNQGDPNGDPNADRLTGISTGTGVVGDGLGNRSVTRSPKIEDNSQQSGTVVVRICVDSDGNVTETSFTQRGSSISDGRLKILALNNAKQWKFSKGDVDKQCGTITYRFRVQ